MTDEPQVDLTVTGKDLGPYLPWYMDDFLGGTTLYDARMIGAYHLLLLHQWAYGYVPRDLTQCQIIGRCDQSTIERILAPEMPERPKFVLHSCGGLINRKMAEVRNERIAHIMEQRRKSALGVEARRREMDKRTDVKQAPPAPVGDPPDDIAGQVAYIQAARDDWRLLAVDVENELKKMPTGPARTEVVRQFCADVRNGDKPERPTGLLRGYISRANPPAAGAPPSRRAFPEQRKKALMELLQPLTQKSYPTDEDRAEITRLRKELKEVNRVIAQN